MKHTIKLMERANYDDEIVIYITKSKYEKLFFYLQFVEYYTLPKVLGSPDQAIRYIRIYMCYDLITYYKSISNPSDKTLEEDNIIRTELQKSHSEKVQDLLKANELMNKHLINHEFTKFFEQLVNDYIFEV